MTIFDFKEHGEYLEWVFKTNSPRRGAKVRFAEAIRIQPAYLSQVLSGRQSLSLEQTDQANQVLEHTADESEYFISMVSAERAATPSLRAHYRNQMNTAVQRRGEVTGRLGKRSEMSAEAGLIYYSSWLYPAIHIACAIPGMRTRRALVKRFKINTLLASKILEFLVAHGLLTKAGDEYSITAYWPRLNRESANIIKHHTNWRMQAIQNLDFQTEKELHFSGIYAVDEASAKILKDRMLEFIKDQMKVIEPSPSEKLLVIGIDLFEPIKAFDEN